LIRCLFNTGFSATLQKQRTMAAECNCKVVGHLVWGRGIEGNSEEPPGYELDVPEWETPLFPALGILGSDSVILAQVLCGLPQLLPAMLG
jgi:hypothetical protein